MSKSQYGIIGLGVMGESLSLNILDKGFTLSVYNREPEKTDEFLNTRAKGKAVTGTKSLQEFAASLETPRKILIMIKAGNPVDDVIELILPYLEKGDVLIDGGNSHYLDTQRRLNYLEKKGILFVGTGVSGGEEGALKGPSLMPGGAKEAWSLIEPLFTAICAKTDHNEPCCTWIGNAGAGHFVKMVHNGIEYADMQIICEVYHFMKVLMEYSPEDIKRAFTEWNKGNLNSYLIEITAKIFDVKDEDGTLLLDKILDSAGQKGTGKWASITALDNSIPLSLISEAVFSRYISAMKDERVAASKELTGPYLDFKGDREEYAIHLQNAMYVAKIISYAQGFDLIKKFSEEMNWDIDLGNIALTWRGGCIIRSAFLDKIKSAYDKNPTLSNLMLDCHFKKIILDGVISLRKICAVSMLNGIPVPVLSAALCYFDSYRSEKLPANLLQAQRDFFGAHTYERTDFPRGKSFHTKWE